jgi:hypothetical protein
MSEFTEFVGGIRVNRIVTKRVIRDLIRASECIQIIRSGVYFVVGHCAEEIEEACNASDRPKEIRIILPSIFNEDVAVRALEAGRSPAEVLAKLGDGQEKLAALAERLAPNHSLELRTTMEPHRYHTIFSESKGILGIPWHTKASLATSSFLLGSEASSLMSHLHEDFDAYFAKCTPYQAGDNERNRKKKTVCAIDDKVLLEFGRTIPNVLKLLRYIVSAFPVADGSGVTNSHLLAQFGMEKSGGNKWLLEMEEAGMLRRIGERTSHDHRHGRLATRYGKVLVEKYKDHDLNQSL